MGEIDRDGHPDLSQKSGRVGIGRPDLSQISGWVGNGHPDLLKFLILPNFTQLFLIFFHLKMPGKIEENLG